MTARKRKPTLKASDKSPEPNPKRHKASTATPKRHQSAPRAVKANRQDPFWLTTNAKSPLADEDLHAELSDPKTYENFTKSDWDDLRECLPSNVPYGSDGYSIPLDFFKYDPEFRRGIREFQEDLSSGRLDPAWQASAAEAMEERARGDFDAYKENQFEEFWGQKQRLDWKAVAGESGKLKLDVLVQNGVFQVGDFLSYSRAMRKASGRLLVEKDCRIVAIGTDTLTVAIPPDQLKYARLHHVDAQTSAEPNGKIILPKAVGLRESAPNDDMGSETASKEDPSDEPVVTMTTCGMGEVATSDSARKGPAPTDIETEAQERIVPLATTDMPDADVAWQSSKAEVEVALSLQDTEIGRPEANDKTMEIGPCGDGFTEDADQDEVIIFETGVLANLEGKILEIDGRANLKEVRTSINAWKAFRGKRNNQDLGTLFEMREEFYVWKYSKLPKVPRNSTSA